MIMIKTLRSQHGMSQMKLAELMRVSRSTIAMWENGGSEPDHCALLRLADIFGVSVDTLLGRSQPMPPAAPAQPADSDAVTPEQLAALDPATRKIADLFSSLPEAERQEALHYIEYIIARSKGSEGGEPDA